MLPHVDRSSARDCTAVSSSIHVLLRKQQCGCHVLDRRPATLVIHPYGAHLALQCMVVGSCRPLAHIPQAPCFITTSVVTLHPSSACCGSIHIHFHAAQQGEMATDTHCCSKWLAITDGSVGMLFTCSCYSERIMHCCSPKQAGLLLLISEQQSHSSMGGQLPIGLGHRGLC